MIVRPATRADLDVWAELRAALWPDATAAEHRAELDSGFDPTGANHATFVALDDGGEVVGFVEASVRRDYVEGCTTSPVAYVEGIYVRPEQRGRDVARALAAAVEAWARAKGLAELASDALLDNYDSHAFHRAIGFDETARTVHFRKAL